MSSEQLVAHGTVRGVFFSLGTTPSHDPRLDCAKAIIDLFNGAQKFRVRLLKCEAHVEVAFLAGLIDPIAALRARLCSWGPSGR